MHLDINYVPNRPIIWNGGNTSYQTILNFLFNMQNSAYFFLSTGDLNAVNSPA